MSNGCPEIAQHQDKLLIRRHSEKWYLERFTEISGSILHKLTVEIEWLGLSQDYLRETLHNGLEYRKKHEYNSVELQPGKFVFKKRNLFERNITLVLIVSMSRIFKFSEDEHAKFSRC